MAEQYSENNQLQLQHSNEDLGVMEQEAVTTTRAGIGSVTIHHHHQTSYYGSTVYKGEGDVIQGLKADVKNSNIESLTGNEKNEDVGTPIHESTAIRATRPRSLGTRRLACLKPILVEKFEADTDEHVHKPISLVRKLYYAHFQITHEEMSLIDPYVMESFSIIARKYGPDKIARDLIDMYSKEDAKDFGDVTQLMTTIWKSMRLKIVSTSFVRHGSGSSNFTSFLATTCLKLISQYNEVKNEDKRLCEFISCLDDVIKIGKQFASENNFIHAVISFYAAANLHRISNNSDDSVEGIQECVFQVRLVVEKMTEQLGMKNIVKDHVIPLMHEMKHYIDLIPGSSRNNRIVNKVWCLFNIGHCHHNFDEYQQFANINETAIELMHRELKDEAAKYRIYGDCLNNAGVAYEFLGKIKKSIEKYNMSLKVYEKAKDWFSDGKKNESTARAEKNVKEAKNKLNNRSFENNSLSVVSEGVRSYSSPF